MLVLFLDKHLQSILILCFVLGWQQSNPVCFGINIFLINHFQFGMDYLFVSLIKRDWNCWASSFNLNFGLIYLILFLDKHSLIHLQLIFHFVANVDSDFWLIADWLLQITTSGTTDTLVLLFLFLDGYVRPIHCILLLVLL